MAYPPGWTVWGGLPPKQNPYTVPWRIPDLRKTTNLRTLSFRLSLWPWQNPKRFGSLFRVQPVCQEMQRWGFLGGKEKRKLSYAGPLFSSRPTKSFPTTSNPQLPPRPTSPACARPPSIPTKRTAADKQPSNAPTKTRKHMMQKAASTAKSFVGKFFLGSKGEEEFRLPQRIVPDLSHRDNFFVQGKHTTAVVSRRIIV